MPRRKRTTGQNERRRKVRRRDNNTDDDEEDDNTLVISDSGSDEENLTAVCYNVHHEDDDDDDDDDEEACVLKVSPRAARRLEREKKAHVQEMTEDEMLDLALRLSKQEANSATQREQAENDNMRKAIAESLQVSCSQASETSSKRTRSVAKPHQGGNAVTARVRCKLSFPSQDTVDSRSDSDVPAAQTGALKGLEEVRPLPPMPDLSQRTLTQPSPPSPALSSVPSVASQQEAHSSHLVKQEFNAHCPEDKASQSYSLLQGSPIFLRECSIRLGTNYSSVSLTSPDQSQTSSPPPKSPVFLKTDSKRCTKLTPECKVSECSSRSSFTDSVCKPEDTLQESSSHKSRDSPKRLPYSRKAPSSSPVSVPEDDKQERVKVKDESSLGTDLSSASVADRATNSGVSSSRAAKSVHEFTSHMVLHLSDDDDDDDDDDTDDEKIIPPSPVFPQDHVSRPGQAKLSPTQRCSSSPTAITTQDSFQTRAPPQAESEQTKVSRKSADSRLEGKDEGLVSYYWGVPFCPKGQSPDDYTRVILAQLEVYEKSLKEAQRRLLHKADWGLPAFPCPVERPHGRRLKRHRVPQLLEEEEEEDHEGRDEEENKKKTELKERGKSRPFSEEGPENSQEETYVVLSSPETQVEPGQKSPLPFRQQEATNSAKLSSVRKPSSQELSEGTRIQSEPEHGEDVQKGGFDVECAACPETQMTEDSTPELMVTSPTQVQVETDVMEVDEVTENPAEAEERMEQERPGEERSWRGSVPSQVECPMCTRLFPLAKIEMHAAYCNGTVEVQDQDQQDSLSQGSSRRKSTRRPATEDDVRFEKSEQPEKCFLCNMFFTSKEYSHHVDLCLQQKTLGSKQGNGLLSALNRTEPVHLDDSGAGPSNTTVRNNRSLAGASVTPGDSVDPQAPSYYVSSSPIKSFTPISEIKDCLINFHQQYSDRTSQRFGRKRKFKR